MTSFDQIDAHAHVWTPDAGRYPRIPGKPDYVPVSFPPEELRNVARAAGVGRFVLVQMGYHYGYDNTFMLDTMRASPGIFSGIALIDHEPAAAPDEMRRLAKAGVRGFRVPLPVHPDTWTQSPGMKRMWTRAAEDGLLICPLINPDGLAGIGRMCSRFPDTTVVIDHLARIGFDGEVRDSEIEALCALAVHPRTCVKVSAFYALGKRRYPYLDLVTLVRRVVTAFGPERLMWASDAPGQLLGGHTYAGSVEFVTRRLEFLSRADSEWLLRKTAARLFFPGG
ncbi:MAG: amidohydrolase [Opitutaceae bacterium]|nr:amidohydrolase [Opitutaceae bacterium]